MLFAFELVSTVTVADGDRQRVHPGLFNKLNRFIRVSVTAALRIAATFLAIVMLRADQHAKLAFHDAVMLVRVIHNLAANLNVLLERLVRRIDHYTGESFVDALLAKFERIAVIEV